MKKKKIKIETPEQAYNLAIEFYKNAKEILLKSKINTKYGIYEDVKYTSEACGIAYLGVLRAIDGFLIEKRILTGDNLPESVDEYLSILSQIIRKGTNARIAKDVRGYFIKVYQNLHILGHYRGGVGLDMIKEGFANAKIIIELLTKRKI